MTDDIRLPQNFKTTKEKPKSLLTKMFGGGDKIPSGYNF